MPTKRILPIIFILFSVLQLKAQNYSPVNENATREVKKILNLLYDIKGRYILSGQQNYNSDRNLFSDSAHNITGKYPAVWGNDFINWGDKDLGPDIVAETCELPEPNILKVQPQWVWFTVWTGWLWTDNTHSRVQEVYNLPQTLSHDEVKGKLGSITALSNSFAVLPAYCQMPGRPNLFRLHLISAAA